VQALLCAFEAAAASRARSASRPRLR